MAASGGVGMDIPPISDQRSFWNDWVAQYREHRDLDPGSIARRDAVLERVARLELPSPRILEIGCGNGWLADLLSHLGNVVGLDLADEVIERARKNHPQVEFAVGDVMRMECVWEPFDLVVCVETLSHVDDQPALVRKCREWLNPGGYLLLTTQNRFVMRRMNHAAPGKGQIRHWLSRSELGGLLRQAELDVRELVTIDPAGTGGILRLVNGRRLNRLYSLALSPARLARLKELAGLGQTLVALARRKYGRAGQLTPRPPPHFAAKGRRRRDRGGLAGPVQSGGSSGPGRISGLGGRAPRRAPD